MKLCDSAAWRLRHGVTYSVTFLLSTPNALIVTVPSAFVSVRVSTSMEPLFWYSLWKIVVDDVSPLASFTITLTVPTVVGQIYWVPKRIETVQQVGRSRCTVVPLCSGDLQAQVYATIEGPWSHDMMSSEPLGAGVMVAFG